MINVIDEEMAGRVDYFTVHRNIFFLFPDAVTTAGIESVTMSYCTPFVLIQSLEIFGIDDGVFSLCQRYPSESVAVADPAVI